MCWPTAPGSGPGARTGPPSPPALPPCSGALDPGAPREGGEGAGPQGCRCTCGPLRSCWEGVASAPRTVALTPPCVPWQASCRHLGGDLQSREGECHLAAFAEFSQRDLKEKSKDNAEPGLDWRVAGRSPVSTGKAIAAVQASGDKHSCCIIAVVLLAGAVGQVWEVRSSTAS